MIHLEFFGSHVGVRVDAGRRDEINRLWFSFVRPADEMPDDATVIDLTGSTFFRTLSNFVVEVNAIALNACRDLAVHAGVLDAGGVTLALPGTSGAGKSTLTAACVRAGMGYVSDEALCLPYETSHVRAYPRPIALSPWSIRALGLEVTPGVDPEGTPATGEATEFIVAPSVLGRTCAAPGPLSHVVVPRRTATEDARLTSLHRADVVALMLKLSFNHFLRPADAFELMVKTVRGIDVWELRYSDPVAAAQLLTDRFT